MSFFSHRDSGPFDPSMLRPIKGNHRVVVPLRKAAEGFNKASVAASRGRNDHAERRFVETVQAVALDLAVHPFTRFGRHGLWFEHPNAEISRVGTAILRTPGLEKSVGALRRAFLEKYNYRALLAHGVQMVMGDQSRSATADNLRKIDELFTSGQVTPSWRDELKEMQAGSIVHPDIHSGLGELRIELPGGESEYEFGIRREVPWLMEVEVDPDWWNLSPDAKQEALADVRSPMQTTYEVSVDLIPSAKPIRGMDR